MFVVFLHWLYIGWSEMITISDQIKLGKMDISQHVVQLKIVACKNTNLWGVLFEWESSDYT